jgi:hypothetical protein
MISHVTPARMNSMILPLVKKASEVKNMLVDAAMMASRSVELSNAFQMAIGTVMAVRSIGVMIRRAANLVESRKKVQRRSSLEIVDREFLMSCVNDPRSSGMDWGARGEIGIPR